MLGAERMVIRDLQAEFVTEMVFRAVQCNAIYVSNLREGSLDLITEAIPVITATGPDYANETMLIKRIRTGGPLPPRDQLGPSSHRPGVSNPYYPKS